MVVILFVSVHVANSPRITSQVQELKDTLQGKCVKLAIQAIGTTPLSYHWQWKPAWQSCNADWCNGATLTIPNMQKSNEGSYRCVISNSAGNQTSKSAELLSVGKDPTINVSMLLRIVTHTSYACVCFCTCSQLSQNHFTITRAECW